MSYGSTAKILRVNLSTGSIGMEELTEDFYRLYPGGKALAGYFLLHEIPAHTEPFAPENVLVMANGLLTGSPVATATRYVVSARSPSDRRLRRIGGGRVLGTGTQNGGSRSHSHHRQSR